MTIKAIETRYAGCRFRSRLESRWAVFFNTLGVEWEYEPQGFELPPIPCPENEVGGCGPRGHHRKHLGAYLPDFWLPRVDGGTWFEVKGPDPVGDEWRKIMRFSELQGGRIVVAIGQIPDPATFTERGPYHTDGLHTVDDHGHAWTFCDACGALTIQWNALGGRHCDPVYRGVHGERQGDHPRILAAYAAAREARFEHGETPVEPAAQLAAQRLAADLSVAPYFGETVTACNCMPWQQCDRCAG